MILPLKAVHEKVFVKELDGPDPVSEACAHLPVVEPGPEQVAVRPAAVLVVAVNVDLLGLVSCSCVPVKGGLALNGDGPDAATTAGH